MSDEINRLNSLVNEMSNETKNKLEKKYFEGCRGWDDPKEYDYLLDSLENCVKRSINDPKQFIDVAIFAAFLWKITRNKHEFYERFDNIPESIRNQITDQNGDIVLTYCKKCNCAEGTLPTECPNQTVPENMQELIQKRVLDYIDDKWVQK